MEKERLMDLIKESFLEARQVLEAFIDNPHNLEKVQEAGFTGRDV